MKCQTFRLGEVEEGVRLSQYNTVFLGYDPKGREVVTAKLHKDDPPLTCDGNGPFHIVKDAYPEEANVRRRFVVLSHPTSTSTTVLLLVDTFNHKPEMSCNGRTWAVGKSKRLDFGVQSSSNTNDFANAKWERSLWKLENGDSIKVQIRGGGWYMLKNNAGVIEIEQADDYGLGDDFDVRRLPTASKQSSDGVRKNPNFIKGDDTVRKLKHTTNPLDERITPSNIHSPDDGAPSITNLETDSVETPEGLMEPPVDEVDDEVDLIAAVAADDLLSQHSADSDTE